ASSCLRSLRRSKSLMTSGASRAAPPMIAPVIGSAMLSPLRLEDDAVGCQGVLGLAQRTCGGAGLDNRAAEDEEPRTGGPTRVGVERLNDGTAVRLNAVLPCVGHISQSCVH